MANIYGGADGVLVGAAYRAAMANVPLDMSGVYEQREHNLQTFTDAMGKLMKPKFDYNEQSWDKINAKAVDLREKINNGDNPFSGSFMDIHVGVIEGYDKRMKSIDPASKKGARERMGLESEMNKYKNLMESNEVMFDGMLNNSADERLMSQLDSPERETWGAIVDDLNNGTTHTKPEYIDGDIFYSLPSDRTVKLSVSDIDKVLTSRDSEFMDNFQANFLTKVVEQAQNSPEGMRADNLASIKTNMFKSITSMKQVINLSKEKFGKMQYTFEEVLGGQATDPITGIADTTALDIIYKELENIGGVDMDGDGDANTMVDGVNIDREMWMTTGNATTLIEALSKDKNKLKELVGGYLLETAVKDYYGQGEELRIAAHNENMPIPTIAQQRAADNAQALYTKTTNAINDMDFSSISGLPRGFILSKDKKTLYYAKDGKAQQNPNSAKGEGLLTLNIDPTITTGEKEYDVGWQQAVMGYITGNPEFDYIAPPFDPFAPVVK